MKGAPIPYSEAEMAWLEANRFMIISDYHAAFVAAFGRADVTAGHLHALRKRKGWKIGARGGRTKGRRLKYSDAEIAWLRNNRTLPIAELHVGFVAAFDRTDITPAQLQSLRKREGLRTGRDGRFGSGIVPANKGKRCPEGKGGRHPNARKTQFRKDALPHNFRGPGHRSIGDDGYRWIVVDQVNPWTGAATRRIHEHRWLWEQRHGPVPKGQVLKCLDGDRLNTDPSNWEAVPRGLLPRLNGKSGRAYDHAPAELKPVVMAMAKLEHAARARRPKAASPTGRRPASAAPAEGSAREP